MENVEEAVVSSSDNVEEGASAGSSKENSSLSPHLLLNKHIGDGDHASATHPVLVATDQEPCSSDVPAKPVQQHMKNKNHEKGKSVNPDKILQLVAKRKELTAKLQLLEDREIDWDNLEKEERLMEEEESVKKIIVEVEKALKNCGAVKKDKNIEDEEITRIFITGTGFQALDDRLTAYIAKKDLSISSAVWLSPEEIGELMVEQFEDDQKSEGRTKKVPDPTSDEYAQIYISVCDIVLSQLKERRVSQLTSNLEQDHLRSKGVPLEPPVLPDDSKLVKLSNIPSYEDTIKELAKISSQEAEPEPENADECDDNSDKKTENEDDEEDLVDEESTNVAEKVDGADQIHNSGLADISQPVASNLELMNNTRDSQADAINSAIQDMGQTIEDHIAVEQLMEGDSTQSEREPGDCSIGANETSTALSAGSTDPSQQAGEEINGASYDVVLVDQQNYGEHPEHAPIVSTLNSHVNEEHQGSHSEVEIVFVNDNGSEGSAKYMEVEPIGEEDKSVASVKSSKSITPPPHPVSVGDPSKSSITCSVGVVSNGVERDPSVKELEEDKSTQPASPPAEPLLGSSDFEPVSVKQDIEAQVQAKTKSANAGGPVEEDDEVMFLEVVKGQGPEYETDVGAINTSKNAYVMNWLTQKFSDPEEIAVVDLADSDTEDVQQHTTKTKIIASKRRPVSRIDSRVASRCPAQKRPETSDYEDSSSTPKKARLHSDQN